MAGHFKPEMTSVVLDSIAEGVFTVDGDWRVSSFNRAAERITGISREEAVGRPCCEVLRASICETECALRHTMETGKPVMGKPIYIVGADGNRIPVSISTALLRDEQNNVIGGVETFRDLSVVEELRKKLSARHTFADIISKNHLMGRIFEVLPRIAESDSTVLIRGESGTGKELFARAIHDLSRRRDKPLVTVNCGAMPDTLLESELFGYKAGAFTDARTDKPGRFAVAEGGTVFLDEIGDVSTALQTRLLRILQDRTYEPLGTTETVRADVRIVTATNRDLEQLVRQKKFREDLYYRINVVAIDLPPLRDRKDDVPLLVDHFVAHFDRLQGKAIEGVSPEVLGVLMNHDFPGNVRELENVIEHAFALCQTALITLEHLPAHMIPDEVTRPIRGGSTLQQAEANAIFEALQRNNWNRLSAADELGIHKTTLWRKIRKLSIELPDRDGRNSPH